MSDEAVEIVERGKRAIELVRLRQRARETGLPVPGPVELTPEEQTDMDAVVKRGEAALAALTLRGLKARVHRLRTRGGPSAVGAPTPRTVLVAIVDESGAELRRALPVAPPPERRPRDTRSAVAQMLERSQSAAAVTDVAE
ncbi:MAG TPA: hypothetical protein VMX12_01435 [Acidimicrobiia bacterium]|nr:hypothetical protein [Acidimicrobiia bacterium]